MEERHIEDLLKELRIPYRKSRNDEACGCVTFAIMTRPGIDLELDLELYPDQVNINFDGCFLMLEQSVFEWRFRSNPKALEEWRTDCLDRTQNYDM